MKIAVIGADGRSGKVFTHMALQAGHTIKAGVHSTSSFAPQLELIVQKCEATDIDQVTTLLQGCDVVVSLIGHSKHSSPTVHTEAIQAIIIAMQSLGQKRIISLTGTGVRMPGDKITLLDRFSELGIWIFDKKRIIDGRNHAQKLIHSNLDWTIVRVSKLQGNHLGNFSLQDNGPAKTPVSRQEVSQAILTILKDNTYVNRAPMISKMPHGEQG